MAPKIGLALGSGAARGWSQIGIIEGLATMGIVPEVVAGTSVGALVGAAFVTGKLAGLKARMESFGRRHVAAMFDLRFTSGGLIEGKRIENFLDELGITGAIETGRPSLRRGRDESSDGPGSMASDGADRPRGARLDRDARYFQSHQTRRKRWLVD